MTRAAVYNVISAELGGGSYHTAETRTIAELTKAGRVAKMLLRTLEGLKP